jgi:hypothetical protein
MVRKAKAGLVTLSETKGLMVYVTSGIKVPVKNFDEASKLMSDYWGGYHGRMDEKYRDIKAGLIEIDGWPVAAVDIAGRINAKPHATVKSALEAGAKSLSGRLSIWWVDSFVSGFESHLRFPCELWHPYFQDITEAEVRRLYRAFIHNDNKYLEGLTKNDLAAIKARYRASKERIRKAG